MKYAFEVGVLKYDKSHYLQHQSVEEKNEFGSRSKYLLFYQNFSNLNHYLSIRSKILLIVITNRGIFFFIIIHIHNSCKWSSGRSIDL